MSDNKEKISQDKEIETKEEVIKVEEVKVEDNKTNGESKVHIEKSKKEGNTFLKRLEAVLIDQIFVGAVAYILLLCFDIVLRYVLGFYVSDMLGMYLVFYIACSVIYPLIIESTKLNNTIGRKFAGLKTVAE